MVKPTFTAHRPAALERTRLLRLATQTILDFGITTGEIPPPTAGVITTGAKTAQAGAGIIGAKIAQMIGGPIICGAAKSRKISQKRKKTKAPTILTAMTAA